MEESKKPDKSAKIEEVEDNALRKIRKKKKARLRTRGPYRQASTINLPVEKSNQ